MLKTITLFLLSITTLFQFSHADYATDYRQLWEQWKKADDAFKAYTKNKNPAEPNPEMVKEAEDIGYQFHTAKRTHPELSAENKTIEELIEQNTDAALREDNEAKKKIQSEINKAYAALALKAKGIPELAKLEADWIAAMEKQKASVWAHDQKAADLYLKVEKLKRQLADLRAQKT